MAFSFCKILPSPHCLGDCASRLIITHKSDSSSDAVMGTPQPTHGPTEAFNAMQWAPRTTTTQMFPGSSAGLCLLFIITASVSSSNSDTHLQNQHTHISSVSTEPMTQCCLSKLSNSSEIQMRVCITLRL